MQRLLLPIAKVLTGQQPSLTLGWASEFSRSLHQTPSSLIPSKSAADPAAVSKRRVAASHLFVKDTFAETKKRNPDKKTAEILSMVMKTFKSLPEAEKAKYRSKADETNQARAKAVQDAIAQTKQANKVTFANKYNVFVKASYAELKKDPAFSAKEAFKQLAQKWKSMTQEQKDKFIPKGTAKS